MDVSNEVNFSPQVLPLKSDIFNANSDSDSSKDRPKELPVKHKKKKKKHTEESEDEKSGKEKKKKKKKEKSRDDKPLPAPESEEEEEEERVLTPPLHKKEKAIDIKGIDIKKRTVEKNEEDDDDGPAQAKKHKKDWKNKDKHKKEMVDEKKRKKVKSRKEIESSDDETNKVGVLVESQPDDTTATDLVTPAKATSSKLSEKSFLGESGTDQSKAKPKKSKSDFKLQGIRDLIQDKNPKKADSLVPLKESGLNKLKSLTSSKCSIKSSRSEEEPDSSDAGTIAKAKHKVKYQESAVPSQKESCVSSSSSIFSSTPNKPKEDEPKEDVCEKEKGVAPNLFEKFLLTCEAKDRVPRKQTAHAPKVQM